MLPIWTAIKCALLEAASERRVDGRTHDHELAEQWEAIAAAPQPGTAGEIEGETRAAFCARRAGAMLALTYDEDDPAATLRDALADLRHCADAHGLPFAAEDRCAHDNYSAEVTDTGAVLFGATDRFAARVEDLKVGRDTDMLVVIERLATQVEQMQPSFDDGDGAIQAALDAAAPYR